MSFTFKAIPSKLYAILITDGAVDSDTNYINMLAAVSLGSTLL